MSLKSKVLSLSFSIFISCNSIIEYEPIEIKLVEEFSIVEAEYSGLVWADEELLLLPQFPSRFTGPTGGNILSIPKETIHKYISGEIYAPIKPNKIGFNDNGISKIIPGFEGFEAIVIHGDSVYLTIEAKEGEGRIGYIVFGIADWENREIHLDHLSINRIQSNSFMYQMSFESLLMWGDSLIAIYEANGRAITDVPQAVVFDKALNQLDNISIPSIEYRLTDATVISKEGFFWMLNYFYPGEGKLKPDIDLISERFGKGSTHTIEHTVERLLQFSFQNGKINLVSTPPIQLALETGISRNWEGIVRLDDRGFLIIADTYPRSLFSFVPYKLD